MDYGKGASQTLLYAQFGKLKFNHSGYELANQTAYLDDMIRWSLDWLIKV